LHHGNLRPEDGDEIGFIYMGDPEADLKAFLERK
jgi:hypothetical protein